MPLKSRPAASNRAASRLGEVDRGVVDHLVGAASLDELPFFRAGGRDHVRAERLRELDGSHDSHDERGSARVPPVPRTWRS
jgi:hypothetical protein